MEVRGIVDKVVGVSNYLLVGAVCFFGFWDINWQFVVWEKYLSYDSCFRMSQIDELIRSSSANEIDGARYMRVVRFITAGLFFALTAFNVIRWCRRNKAEKKLRAERYKEDLKRKSVIMNKTNRQEQPADPDDSAVKSLNGRRHSQDTIAIEMKKIK